MRFQRNLGAVIALTVTSSSYFGIMQMKLNYNLDKILNHWLPWEISKVDDNRDIPRLVTRLVSCDVVRLTTIDLG